MTRAVFLLLLSTAAARAVEIHIQFGALERMLAEQVFVLSAPAASVRLVADTDADGKFVFTQEGRRYVRGAKTNKCNFAYLEMPQIQGDAGRLRMRAHFTGQAALNLIGQCVGMGDAFDVTITATPVYKGGAIGLQEVKVASDGKASYYIRKVCAAMESSLSRDFKYPLERDTQWLLENPGVHPQYKREVRKFNVPELRVTNDALVLAVDFEMTIK